MDQVAHDDLDTAGVLVEIGRLRRARDDADRGILLLATHYADLHSSDTPAGSRTLPGTERPVRLAGAGSPLVAEFAAAELALELETSTFAAKRLLGDALELRHRLPRLWSRLLAGDVLAWLARRTAQSTRDLSPEQAAYVDHELAPVADGRLPAGRFLTLLEATVIAADPETAAERERAAATERFAKVGRSNEHGQKTLYVKTSAAEMIRIDATIGYLADALRTLGDPDPLDLRRTKAVLLLANPVQALTLIQALATRTRRDGSAEQRYADGDVPLPDDEDAGPEPGDEPATGLFRRFRPSEVPACTCQGGAWTWDPSTTRSLFPAVTMYLHLDGATVARDDGTGVARWEGEGPVTSRYVRDFLGPHAAFTIKPVIDLAHQAPVDAYEVRGRLREAVHLRSPADFFPWATSTSRAMDAEHVRPYVPPDDGGPPGQSRMGNLGFLGRYHHRLKTHGGWQVEQPFDGIYVWRSPHGAITLVDHTGTRTIRGAQTRRARRTTAHDVVVHLPVHPTSAVENHLAELLVSHTAC